MKTTTCPPPAELARFALGDLPQPVFARVADHVQHCADCEDALQALENQEDALVSQLRLSADVASAEVPEPLLETARSALLGKMPSPVDGPTRTLENFELLEELGIGSFGHVFRAGTHGWAESSRSSSCAGRFASPTEVERFLHEAKSAALLKHPGIVALFDTGQTDEGTYYLVEEFVRGQTLAAALDKGPFDFRRAVEIVVEVAQALAYAHQTGVVHRDIKPSNIVIDEQGKPHLMDFGLAKRETDETPMTLDGQVLGTPAYMSPEQARGDTHQVDARTDIYSLGVVLFELLTGEKPFRGNRRMLLSQVLEDEPRPPRSLNDKIPRDLETICLKAMAKTPARRYATAKELADDLQRWLRGEPIVARPIGVMERLWRWCRRNPLAAGFLLAITLGSATGMAHLVYLSDYLVKQAALESAAQQSEMLDQVNDFYSDQVVDRLQGTGIKVSHNYTAKKGSIPLPATLTIELGKHLSAKMESGMQVRLFSDHPFKPRRDSGEGGPKDDFDKDALERLRHDPDMPVYSFEDFRGRPSLRYATARRMKRTCVECHNQHEDSTKRDWKEGDVPGVLEIIRPLETDVARTREGLRGTFLGMALISGTLLGGTVLFLVVRNRRRVIP